MPLLHQYYSSQSLKFNWNLKGAVYPQIPCKLNVNMVHNIKTGNRKAFKKIFLHFVLKSLSAVIQEYLENTIEKLMFLKCRRGPLTIFWDASNISECHFSSSVPRF